MSSLGFQAVLADPLVHSGNFGMAAVDAGFRIWDPAEARFETWFHPYAAGLPLVVAGLLVLGLVLQPILPYPPRWAKDFIKEEVDDHAMNIVPVEQPRTYWTLTLVIISVIGLALQGTVLGTRPDDLPTIFVAVSWALSVIVIFLVRRETAPISLLVLYVSMMVSQLTVLLAHQTSPEAKDLPEILQPLVLIIAISVVLSMPLRPSKLSREGLSPPFAIPDRHLRSPEDSITLWQWMTISWMKPLISIGKTRQLNEDDVWSLPYGFQHRRLHDTFRDLRGGSMIRRLLAANGIDLIISTLLGVIDLLALSAAPVLLQKLLQAMEDPLAPRRAAVTYAVLSFVVGLIACQANVFQLWYARRSYERSRGEMITMLYEKTLSRKMVSGAQKEDPSGTPDPVNIANGSDANAVNSENQPKAEQGRLQKFRNTVSVALHLPAQFLRWGSRQKAQTEVKQPASMGKILNLMRNDVYEVAQRFWDCKDLVTVPLQVIVSVILIWKILGWACLIGVFTIIIAQLFNVVLARLMVSWEKRRRMATDKKLQVITQFVEAIRHLRWYGWQGAWLNEIVEKRQQELHLILVSRTIRLAIMFTSVSSSQMFPVAAFWAYAVLAGKPLRVDIAFPAVGLFSLLEQGVRRVPDLITVYLNAAVSVGRLEDFMSEPDKEESKESWDQTQPELLKASFAWPATEEPVLREVSLRFDVGMTVIGGKVGTGKSALLLSLLGELELIGGEYMRSNQVIGYCEQRPWLQSMSIRENILFHTPYDDVRYKQVLDACCLTPDFASFKNGDLSNIGENGIGLSGGQRARVALARAVYSHAKILMLDDPLSALDHQTAESIADRCFNGPLVEGRTLILVTHRLDLCRNIADQYIEVSDGTTHVKPVTSLPSMPDLTRGSKPDEESNETTEKQMEADAVPDKFIEDEHRAHGGVEFSVYWEYIKASKLQLWALLVVILAFFRLFALGKTWFLKEWGEAYDRGDVTAIGLDDYFKDWPSPEVDVHPWLLGFLFFSVGQALSVTVAQVVMIAMIYAAGRRMFKEAIQSVANATFRFYDVTPVGRLMNRMTSDMSTVDGEIGSVFQIMALFTIIWISSAVAIASITPMFLAFAVAMTVAFIMVFRRFLPSSQSLRRLEMTSLSPLLSDFGALLDGLTTVRAFCAQSRFQDRVIAVTDNFQRMDHFYWSLQSWLTYRFDNISNFATFLLTIVGLYTAVSPGLLAFALTAATALVMATHRLCLTYGKLQMDFVSVERVVELLRLEQEPPGDIMPPAAWPTHTGDIVFDNVTVRYAPHLDPALTNLSFRIKGGSTTAIVGRTGSGKSTVAATLLGTIIPGTGSIKIDGIDIADVNKHALRTRVTFLAQDPVLFPGRLRQNLDPLEEHSDEDCERVLQKVYGGHEWSLNTHVDTGGRNFSQGQRQLIGLARAILRRSAIVILDEATASIDMATSMQIQEVLREEMRESTVITIAHRVEAVRDADSCLVLDKGTLLEHQAVGGQVEP